MTFPYVPNMQAWIRRSTLEAIHPDARPYFDELLAEAKRRGYEVTIASAVRDCDEQAKLVADNSTPARCSWHLNGRAVDLHLNGKEWNPAYPDLGAWWKERGGTWGGDFGANPAWGPHGDFIHFQWTPPGSEKELCIGDGCEDAWKAHWSAITDASAKDQRQTIPGGTMLRPGQYAWTTRDDAEDIALGTWVLSQRERDPGSVRNAGYVGGQLGSGGRVYDIRIEREVPYATGTGSPGFPLKQGQKPEDLFPTKDPSYTADVPWWERMNFSGLAVPVVGLGLATAAYFILKGRK